MSKSIGHSTDNVQTNAPKKDADSNFAAIITEYGNYNGFHHFFKSYGTVIHANSKDAKNFIKKLFQNRLTDFTINSLQLTYQQLIDFGSIQLERKQYVHYRYIMSTATTLKCILHHMVTGDKPIEETKPIG